MDRVRRAVEAGRMTLADIAEIHEDFREVLREAGVPVREKDGPGAGQERCWIVSSMVGGSMRPPVDRRPSWQDTRPDRESQCT